METLKPLDVINAYGNVPLSLPGHLAARVQRHGDKRFLSYRDEMLTYAEFDSATDRLAEAFRQRGVGKSDCIAVISRNHPAHLLTLFAAAKIGAIMVPVNPEFGPSELAYILGDAGVAGIVAAADLREIAGEAAASAGITPFFLEIGEDGADGTFETAMAETAGRDDAPAPAPEDPCLIIYTSGTTGKPKGVVHSQRNFLLCGQINIQRLHLQPSDVVMIVLPFFHVNALFYSTAGAFCAGAAIAVVPRFSASRFWHQAVEFGATTVNVIEAIGNILLARDRWEFRPENRIRVIYGVRPRYEEEFRREFGIPQIVSGYGLTEIPGVTCGNLEGPNAPYSMGKVIEHPAPGVEWAQCRIVDDDGNDLPDGAEGELLIRSPAMMLGYYRDAEATAAAVRDGWFATGDIVRRSAEGEYFFVSRKKDIIRRRGENISGVELDQVVSAHPDVHEAAAIAVPSELGEDEILVAVVVKPGKSLTAAQVTQWCAERLAPMKVPRFVTFVDELPHTPTHKVSKAALRADPALLQRAEEPGRQNDKGKTA